MGRIALVVLSLLLLAGGGTAVIFSLDRAPEDVTFVADDPLAPPTPEEEGALESIEDSSIFASVRSLDRQPPEPAPSRVLRTEGFQATPPVPDSRVHVFLVRSEDRSGQVVREGSAVAVAGKPEAIVSLRTLLGAEVAEADLGDPRGPFPVEEVLAFDLQADLARIRIGGGWSGASGAAPFSVGSFPGRSGRFRVWVGPPVVAPPGSMLRGELRLSEEPHSRPGAVAIVGAAPDVGGALLDEAGEVFGILHPAMPWEERRLGSGFDGLRDPVAYGDGLTLLDLTVRHYEGTPRADLEAGLLAWLEGDTTRATPRFLELLRSDPGLAEPHLERIIETFISRSNRDRARGDLPTAAQLLADAARLIPSAPRLRLQLGRTYLEMGEDALALEELLAVVRTDNSFADELSTSIVDIFQRMGERALREGRHDEAYGLMQRALDLFPDHASLLFLLGRILHGAQNFEDAVPVFERAASIDPSLTAAVEPYLSEADRALGGGPVVEIRYPPNARRIAVDILLADRGEELFILDTGATNTVLTPAAANRLGLRIDYRNLVRVSTAGGVVDAPLVRIPSLDLKGMRVNDIEAVVLDLGDPNISGLIGLDFLNHFIYSVDAAKGILTLREQ